jgi:hypothetical protein
MSGTVWGPGPISWNATRDGEGYREYKVAHRVRVARGEGPAAALNASGLPLPGSFWSFGLDLDTWAWCRPDANVQPEVDKETNIWFIVEQTFSTKPIKRCQDEKIEDPLLELPKVSGGFSRYTEEATHDRFAVPILNSAHERIKGNIVEFDRNRPSVRIQQNVATNGLALTLPALMIDTVNALPMWGMNARCVKLSSVSWERQYYGTCSVYYSRTLEFDLQYETFDRNALDEGTKVLRGKWHKSKPVWIAEKVGDDNLGNAILPSADDPNNFIRATDRTGNAITLVLDGAGRPHQPEPWQYEFFGTAWEAEDQQDLTRGTYFLGPYDTQAEAETGGEDFDITADYGWVVQSGATQTLLGTIGDAIVAAVVAGSNRPPIGPFVDEGDAALWLSDLANNLDTEFWWAIVGAAGNPGNIHIQRYPESNFFLMGIPVIL